MVFPVVSLNSQAGQVGFAQDMEYGEQTKAIHLYVNQINAAGGINGRKINPIIVSFDPTEPRPSMRALCKQWTEGSPAAFAVLDGIGTWEGDNQLCVTQEGQTPADQRPGPPPPTGPSSARPTCGGPAPTRRPCSRPLVQWGLSSGRLGQGKKVGIVVADQASDQAALNDYLLPDLKKVGHHADGARPSPATPTRPPATNSDARWRWRR